MIGFIWKNLWRHKERFILLLVGAIIISSGLSYLVGLSETNKGTIEDCLQKRWKASYDIVVRPLGTKSITEEKGLLEPNYLSGIDGGISRQQYETIKAIEGIQVAAPVSMVGYINLPVKFKDVEIKDNGIYRQTITVTSNNGAKQEKIVGHGYYNKGPWEMPVEYAQNPRKYIIDYGVGPLEEKGNKANLALSNKSDILLVGIDPDQEAKLVGLDQAMVSTENGRYFTATDRARITNFDSKIPNIPIIINQNPYIDETYTITIEKLDLPYEKRSDINKTMATIKENGGRKYLDKSKVEEKSVQSYTFDSKSAHNLLIQQLIGIDPQTGKKVNNNTNVMNDGQVYGKASPIQYQLANSPFPERWPFAYQVNPVPANNDELNVFWDTQQNNFREEKVYDNLGIGVEYRFLGFYDSQKMSISRDPLNELPMETYRPAMAKLVMDANGQPVNPPANVKPTSNPNGFLTSPPVVLTTLDAAEMIAGKQPISAIRIKVAGVDNLNEDSQAKIEKIAKQIEDQTGLNADITLGSSPQPAIVNIPKNGDSPALGWIEQPWVRLGAAMTIFREIKMGFSGIIFVVLLVAIVYVFAANLVSVLSRRKEFAVLLSIGWRPSQLAKMVVLEAILLGTFVALVAWGMEGFALLQNDMSISPVRFLMVGLSGFLIYLLGSIWPAFIVTRIAPYETMQTGEITKNARRIVKIRSLFVMAFSNLIGKVNRSVLSILAIAVPTTLLVFFLFITFRLQGVLYTTWLGQFISLEIGPAHYIAMVIALLVAILTTTEIMWQNVMERKPEIVLLKSMGWRNGPIRFLIIWEGFLVGLIAGIVGIGIALVLIWRMYNQFPLQHLGFILATGLIPMIVGMIGAFIPAEMAVRLKPSQGLIGQYTTKKQTAKRFGTVLTIFSVVAFVAFGATLITILPKDTAPASAGIDGETKGQTKAVTQPTTTVETTTNVAEGKSLLQKEESKATYDLQLTMKTNGLFEVSGQINVQNLSKDTWNQLEFYLLPNQYTDKSIAAVQNPATLKIKAIQVNGQKQTYQLKKDKLTIPFTQGVKPNDSTQVTISYQLTLPTAVAKQGLLFEKKNDNYYLGEWYPILATYQNGWKQNDFYEFTKHFFTNPSDFKVQYQLPKEYIAVTSGIDSMGSQTGQRNAKEVKEFYVAFLKNMKVQTKVVGNVTVRVYGHPEKQKEMSQVLDTAAKTISYFEQKIGPSPSKEIDIILEHSGNFAFPGVMTLYDLITNDFMERRVVTQLAYQWLDTKINVNPERDQWISESMAELAASLYYMDVLGKSESEAFQFSSTYLGMTKGKEKKSNLALTDYQDELQYMTYVVAQPTMNLWQMISEAGEQEAGWKFLQGYEQTYAGEYIDTNEFVRYLIKVYALNDVTEFEHWLDEVHE